MIGSTEFDNERKMQFDFGENWDNFSTVALTHESLQEAHLAFLQLMEGIELTWLFIKWTYCQLPGVMQRFMIKLMYPVIFAAKFFVTDKNPLSQNRGLDFYYDVVDWVGGYPYEYIDPGDCIQVMNSKGFTCLRKKDPAVPTGCGEFVFQKV
jgi:hypothetical protein